MKMGKMLVAVVLFLSFVNVYVYAEASLDSGNFTVNYHEPTTNADGTSLTDLAYTTIYYSLDGNEKIKAMENDIPATSQFGGGNIQQTFTIDNLGRQVDVLISYTATDQSENESEEFTEVIIRIDQVAPNKPNGEV